MVMGLVAIAALLAMIVAALINIAGAPIWVSVVSYPIVGTLLVFSFAVIVFKFRRDTLHKGDRSTPSRGIVEASILRAGDRDFETKSDKTAKVHTLEQEALEAPKVA